MKIFVGVTHPDWYQFLREASPGEVNFWRPGGQNFAALTPGELFLFKLKAPYNAIAGGGFYVRYTQLPLSLAWDVFGPKNGAADYRTFRHRLIGLRSDGSPNPQIGCIILTSPFFFSEDEWIKVPDSFAKNIVSGKTYDTQVDADGQTLWRKIQGRLASRGALSRDASSPTIVAEELKKYGAAYVANNRLGQSGFRAAVTDAYHRRCAFTGEKTLPALQASHIKPYAESGPHQVNNGLLLRADLHQLFDRGYITLTSNYKVVVSDRIREEFNNGKEYLALSGSSLHSIPEQNINLPSEQFVQFHNDHVYVE